MSPPIGRLFASPATGRPIPHEVARPLEERLHVDVSGVRVHDGSGAGTAAAAFGARAFAYGPNVFLGAGERPTDLGLMAHEVTHVVQQQGVPQLQRWTPGGADCYEQEANRASAAVLRSESFAVRESTSQQVQRLGISDAFDYFAEKAYLIPGFRMFTILLGVNPINWSRVERSAANILRALIEFIPGGALITQALDNYGIFERVGAWVDDQLRTLGMTGSMIGRAIDEFLDSLSWTDIFDLGGVWERAKRIFTEPIRRIIDFAAGLVAGIIRFIKAAILRPLAALAEGTRGYDLLKAVLGQDPITGEPVPRNANTLIGGFMKLIGKEEVWENLKRARAVERAWAWVQGALSGLLGFVRGIPQLFLSALQQLELADLVLVPRAFAKIARVFGGFVLEFLGWAGRQVLSLLQIIFEVVAPRAMPYLQRAMGAFRTIIENPVRFIGHLVRAGIQGFRQFGDNFLGHLRTSLIQWLTGTLAGANIYIPQAFEIREIIKFVLSVLGLTWQNIRAKLVRPIGEAAVTALETTFDIVVTLVREGPAAAWEKIREQLTNLRELVVEQVMTFVRERIVQAAIRQLVTSLNPAGAFIQAVIAIYNTIMFFVERLQQIAQVAMSFIDSIAAIASGAIGAAANRVEQTMAGLLTLVISFLARLVGLGRVSDAVVNIVNRIREPIDRALDRVVEWIVATARGIGRAVSRSVQRIVDWWRQRKEFRANDGQRHELFFTDARELTVSSAPQSVAAILRDIRRTKQPVPREVDEAEDILLRITQLVSGTTAAQPVATRETESIGPEIERRLGLLAAKLAVLLGPSDLPLTNVTFQMRSNLAYVATTMPLTSRAGNTTPSEATSADLPSDPYQLSLNRTRSIWRKMHLVSFRLMGPNASWNLASGDASANASMATVEGQVAARLAGNPPTGTAPDERIRWYETKVEFHPGNSAVPYQHYFARTIQITEGRFDPGTRAKQEIRHGPWPSQSPPANVSMFVVNFSHSGHEVISTAVDPRTGVPLGATTGQRVVDARGGLRQATGGRQQWANEQELETYLRQVHLGVERTRQVMDLLRQYPAQFQLR